MNRMNRRTASCRPAAAAEIRGSDEFPTLRGSVRFYPVNGGSLVTARIFGLPKSSPFAAMHIHNGKSCTGSREDNFADAGTHLNLSDSEHPLHTGDLPALMNSGGSAYIAFVTDRFTPGQVIGYPVVIHRSADDYHTQPSGGSGTKIGCGIIRAL